MISLRIISLLNVGRCQANSDAISPPIGPFAILEVQLQITNTGTISFEQWCEVTKYFYLSSFFR